MQKFFFYNDFRGKKYLNVFRNLIERKFLFAISIFFCNNVFAGNLFSDSAKQPTAITLNITTVNSTCERYNGRIIVNASGGILPYTYELVGLFFPVTASGIFYNLPPITCTVKVTDAIGTTATQVVTVLNTLVAPAISAVTDKISPTNCNTSNGSLKIIAGGGLPPYMYSLDDINYQPSNVYNNLDAGNYTYCVKDANGCVGYYNEIAGPNQSILLQSSNCSIVELFVSPGGTCPYGGNINVGLFSSTNNIYEYSLDGINYQLSPSFTNITIAGLYTVRIKDIVTGDILNYAVSTFNSCTYAFKVALNIQAFSCTQFGSINITASEGTAPYQYSIDGINFQSSNQFNGLTPGTYTIVVKDASEFLVSKLAQIIDNCLQVIPTTTSSTCGNSNGKITAQASKGVAPYEYSLNGGAYSSGNVFNNLAANNYVVRAKDATNRVATANTVVSNIAGAQIIAADTTATVCSNNTGTITVQTQAGTLPYLYSIDGTNFQNTGLFTGLAQNSYTVTVKDGRGCLTTKPALITVNNNLLVDAGNNVTTCEGKNGTTNATGNATSYAWLPTGGLATPNLLNTSASAAQTTTYYLTGTTGVCTKTDSMLVLVKPAPIAVAGQGQTICFGKNASLQAAAGQVSYTWQPSTFLSNANVAFTDVIKPTSTTTYNLSVVGTNGCASLQAGQVTIQVTPPPKVFVGNDTSIAIGEPFILQARDVSGSGFNQFAWQPFYLLNDATAQYPLIQNIKDNTTFSVIATTAAGCVGKDSINIKVFTKPDIYVPNAFTPNADGNNDVLRAIPVGIKLFKFFTVYDRYGRQIFNTNNPKNGWDGKTNGSLNNTGSFIWITAGIDYAGRIVERKGAVVLVR